MADENILKKIEKALSSSRQGLTINQIMENTQLSRGTVKSYLDELIAFGRVHEEEYAQNTKIYFLNGVGEFQEKVQMFDDGILFLDLMTDPWKRPFLRIKFRDKKEDKGAIFISDEEAVDSLIISLQKIKPQFKKYRQLVEKLDSSNTKV